MPMYFYTISSAFLLLISLCASSGANAWFFFIPTGAIIRALETDPDSISVSAKDRALGKCAGAHLNQAEKFSVGQSSFPAPEGTPLPPPESHAESPATAFHANMVDVAVDKASDKSKVRELAGAYSTRWKRVAGSDISANRAYGADLARGCVESDIPLTLTGYADWRAKKDEEQRVLQEQETARRQAEEAARAARMRTPVQVEAPIPVTIAASPHNVDFNAEAKKSALILGCVTQDVRVIGADAGDVVFSAICDTGTSLTLKCDQTGLCLKK